MRGHKITKDQISWIIQKEPHVSGDNTEFYIAFINQVCDSWGYEPLPSHIKEVMRAYKPEAVTRKRREFTESTPEQRKKEKEMKHDYAGINP